jgi:YD repeat-containing protein
VTQGFVINGTGTQVTGDQEVDYTYDQVGRVATMAYPWWSTASTSTPNVPFTYSYDTMGRPASLTDPNGFSEPSGGWPVTWVQNVQYDLAGRMASMQYQTDTPTYYQDSGPVYATKAMSYNVNGQLSSLSLSGGIYGSPAGTIQYNYSTTQNNGQITGVVDGVSGETITYQYDALKRLSSASSTAAWTQSNSSGQCNGQLKKSCEIFDLVLAFD